MMKTDGNRRRRGLGDQSTRAGTLCSTNQPSIAIAIAIARASSLLPSDRPLPTSIATVPSFPEDFEANLHRPSCNSERTSSLVVPPLPPSLPCLQNDTMTPKLAGDLSSSSLPSPSSPVLPSTLSFPPSSPPQMICMLWRLGVCAGKSRNLFAVGVRSTKNCGGKW